MRTKSKSKTIYLFRHGEDKNDLEGKFGGWSDPSLTQKGRGVAKKRALEFKKIPFDIILTSPLKRALESAVIISKITKVKLKEYIYLKERNTYGILGGVTKKETRKTYPELYKAYNAQEFIAGGERYDDFKNRVDTLLSNLFKMPYNNILCVTHGYLITTIMEEFLSLNREKIEDGCYITLEVVNNKFEFNKAVGITYSEGTKTFDSKRYRKFK